MANKLGKLYRCHKEVRAMKIAELHPGREDKRGHGVTIVSTDGERVSVSDSWISTHSPVVEGGYFVMYKDGYESFSPAHAFETGYTEVTDQ